MFRVGDEHHPIQGPTYRKPKRTLLWAAYVFGTVALVAAVFAVWGFVAQLVSHITGIWP